MKKFIVVIMILCLMLQLVGCYTPQLVTKEEFMSAPDNPGIVVMTDKKIEYAFTRGSYKIENDSIHGHGSQILENGAKVNINSPTQISLAEVETFKVEKIDAAGTIIVGAITVGLAVLIIMGIKSLMEDTTKSIAEGIGRGLSGVFK